MTRIVATMLLALLCAFPAAAKDEEAYVWERISEVDLTQQEIITYAHAYIAENFGSSKEIIELNDPALGKLVGTITVMSEDARRLHAFHGANGRLIIDAKDGRYRIQMTNIVGTDANGVKANWGRLESANRYRIQPMAESALDRFANNLQTYLANAKANSDW